MSHSKFIKPFIVRQKIFSTPLYQVVGHALADKNNTTKFKLLFSNVTEKDILLREELDALKKKYPNNFDVVYLLDKPSGNWTGDIFSTKFPSFMCQ